MPEEGIFGQFKPFASARRSACIVRLRLAAIALMIAAVYLLGRLMLWLPWEVDCVIAAACALAFAYRFERGASR